MLVIITRGFIIYSVIHIVDNNTMDTFDTDRQNAKNDKVKLTTDEDREREREEEREKEWNGLKEQNIRMN